MKSRSGFTIVELLVVIVVIAILAGVSVVAYSGIQHRAENAKTTQALVSWVKILKMYKIEHGDYPKASSCLGNVDTYADEYGGVCRWKPSNTSYTVKPSFLAALGPYVENFPEPSTKNINTESSIYRGIYYYYNGFYDSITINAIIHADTIYTYSCPEISGLVVKGFNPAENGKNCLYEFRDRRS